MIVRHFAVEAFMEIIEKGDDGAIAAVYARLEDTDWHLREAAMAAIRASGKIVRETATRGNAGAIAVVSAGDGQKILAGV